MIRFQFDVFRDNPNIIYKKTGLKIAIYHEILEEYRFDSYGKIL